MGLLQLKIDNSKRHADFSKRKWKDPGAKLYDQCLNAFFCKGDVPCDTKQLNQAMKDGTYKQWPDFLKEVYLVAPVEDINNSPYGITPFSRSGCKYPHHVIKNGELVISVSGLKRAWDMAFYQKAMTPEVKRHLNRHMKELGIEPFFHHGQLYWNEQAESWKRIESNFEGIYSYLNEQLGINLHEDVMAFGESYSVYEDESQVANGVNSEDYIRPLNWNDVTGEHFIDWFFKMDEFENDKPENFDFNILVNNPTIKNYCYGYFINMKLEGIIRIRYNNNQKSYSISMLFVNTNKWRMGIGDSLMKYVVSKYGKFDLYLRVFAFNNKAFSLYTKYDFKIIESDIYKDGPDRDPKFVGEKMHIMKRDAVQNFEDHCDNMTDFKGCIISVGDLNKYKISEEELEKVKSRFLKEESIDTDQHEFSDNLPNIMYFSSPHKVEELKGRVFLSPYIGISSLFIIDRHKAFREYAQSVLGSRNLHISCNLGYEEWGLPNEQLVKPLDTVHVTHNIQEIPGIASGTSTGYIYTVDISNINKDQLSLFTTRNPDREIIYTGDEPLRIVNIQQHTTEWTIKFSKENAKHSGFGSVTVKESYDSIEDIKEKYYNERGGNVDNDYDDLSWIEAYLTEEGEDPNTPPSMPDEPKEESMPKKTDKAESSKNGIRRKNLYIEFIKWCKEYNPKNTFGSIFDKDAFNVTYPFIPDEMRYFYRLANPMLCVLGGNLTFFAAAELRKINAKNSHLNEMMIFAATNEDVRVFNVKDKKIYRGTEENGTLKLNESLGDTFDTYLQKMINKGDILNAPIEESAEAYVEN